MSSPLWKDGRGAPHGRPSPHPDVLKQGDEFGGSQLTRRARTPGLQTPGGTGCLSPRVLGRPMYLPRGAGGGL